MNAGFIICTWLYILLDNQYFVLGHTNWTHSQSMYVIMNQLGQDCWFIVRNIIDHPVMSEFWTSIGYLIWKCFQSNNGAWHAAFYCNNMISHDMWFGVLVVLGNSWLPIRGASYSSAISTDASCGFPWPFIHDLCQWKRLVRAHVGRAWRSKASPHRPQSPFHRANNDIS